MYRKPKKLNHFYKSNEWHLARVIKIANQNGLCENCGKPENEVHHIIHLTINNVDDLNISLNQSNLKLLCIQIATAKSITELDDLVHITLTQMAI